MDATAGLKAKKILTPNDIELGSLPFRLMVWYDQPLQEAVELGNCDQVDSSVFKLPLMESGAGRVMHTAHLINEPGLTEGDELAGRMEGLRHARVEELLAFGIQYPETQRLFPVVAFGSAVKIGSMPGVWQTPYLVGNAKERRLGMGAKDFAWSDRFRFLTISLEGYGWGEPAL